MRFEWSEAKNQKNFRKHGIDFETATFVFDDPYAVAVLDRVVEGEERWQTIGSAGGIVIILVAHTVSENLIRIISARKATPQERRSYEDAY